MRKELVKLVEGRQLELVLCDLAAFTKILKWIVFPSNLLTFAAEIHWCSGSVAGATASKAAATSLEELEPVLEGALALDFG